MLAKSHAGFTLIELVMTIIIFGIISVIVGQALFHAYQSFLISRNISEADWEGLIAMERIVNDIHTIRGASDISTIGSSQLTFTDVNGASVSYQVSGNSLLRNGQVLASGISAFVFGYLDKNGVTTGTTAATRFISVSLTATVGGEQASFSSLANIRILS